MTTIWDTAGQEAFKSLTKIHYKDTDGALLVFDLTRRKTFDNLRNWIEEFKMSNKKNSKIILIGNKLDIVQSDEDLREVSKEEVLAFARMEGMMYKEVSAVTAKNVEDAFIELLQAVYEDYNGEKGEDFGVPLRATSFADHGTNSRVVSGGKGGCC